jgi:hypothetical protein
MKNLIILIIACTVFSFNLSAQQKSYRETRADKFAYNYSYDRVIKTLSGRTNLSVEGQRNLAVSYHKMDQNTESEKLYSKLITNGIGIVAEDYYNYAMVLKMNGKNEASNIQMDQFVNMKPEDLRSVDYRANKKNLASMLSDKGELSLTQQKMNTEALDFGTSYFNNRIVFASTRTTRKLFVRKFNWTNKPFWDMYVADVKNGQLENPELLSKKLNGSMHDGPASFSKKGTFMAYSRNNYKNKDMVVELQIWFCTLTDGQWSKPVPFKYNSPDYSVTHPSLSADGLTMYFASDMPGSTGGYDIYKTTRSSQGEWTKPVNSGNKINTEGDELFPFISEDSKILLFSSNGLYGLGGLDIFVSLLNNDQWGKAYNPGTPLNTQYDDFAAIFDNKTEYGYFSSNRKGGSGGDDIYALELIEPKVEFSVNTSGDVPVVKKIRETFPLRNYIFFDGGSTQIPDRYVKLNKQQVVGFKEDQLEEFTSKHPSGRSARQMNVYYNVINILGNRMYKYPGSRVTLVGSSENGINDAKKMAESVKSYLVDIFGISRGRITTTGRLKPKLPSEKPGGELELILLREGDQRVSIESNSPEILMEFQSGPEVPLKPVEIVTLLEPVAEGKVRFTAKGWDEAFTDWTFSLKDERGRMRFFGPFTEESVHLSEKNILENHAKNTYNAIMTGTTRMGKTITREASFKLDHAVAPKVLEVTRFSIIYEFDDSKAITIYEKYLTEIVTAKIPQGGKVIIRGHTDNIGDTDYNLNLSIARANDVKKIIGAALEKANRKDVKFEVSGLGENESESPFENKYPEERFYNRTVIIDIISE